MSDKTLHVPRRDDRQSEPAHATHEQEPVHPPVHGEWQGDDWKPPMNLEAPPPRPGMVQRWIRVDLRGDADTANLARAMREGWRPRSADSVGDFAITRGEVGKFSGVVTAPGMVLCEMPAEINEKRKRFYAEMTQRQTRAVETDLERAQAPGMPIMQTRKSQVTTGHGRRPVIPAEDT